VAAEAIRTDLAESKIAGIMPASVIRETLREMRRSPDTPLNLPAALEIATRRGARAVIHGDVTPLGGGFVATLRLLASTTGDELTSYREVANTPNELIPAFERLSRSLRREIGERLRDVQATPPLADVTTGSLEALKKYVESGRLGMQTRSAIPPLLEAVQIDSNFAMAWRRLGILYGNFGYPASAIEPMWARAFRARDHLKPLERAYVDAMYYGSIGDRGRRIEIYERLIRERGLRLGIEITNLPLEYADRREFDRAESLMRELLQAGLLTPRAPNLYENWPYILFNRGKLAEADSAIGLFERQPGKLRMMYMIATGRLDSALLVSTELRATDDPEAQTTAWAGEFVVKLTQGRIAEAMRALAQARFVGAPVRASILALNDSIRAADIDVMLDRRDRAVRRLDASLARTPLRSLAPRDGPYFLAAAAYAKARRPDRARAIMAQYDREVIDTLVRRRVEHERKAALAEIALAEARADEAVALFRQADLRPDGPADDCVVRLYLRLARAFDAAQRTDSALSYYERYLTTPFFTYVGHRYIVDDTRAEAIGWVHLRLAELYDKAGNRTASRVHYAKVADMWKDADPELQPKVTEARRRAASQ
jgi:tetratricopeptide (TPR) repeat protein